MGKVGGREVGVTRGFVRHIHIYIYIYTYISISVTIASERRASEGNTVVLGHLSPPGLDADLLDPPAPDRRGLAGTGLPQ